MSIEARNISKYYGAQKALDDVSFSIGSGEVVGFLGPNGAGKSTMMKIITCFLPPSEGEVMVCGHEVSKDPMAVRRLVGYLPEHNPLYTDMYVREYLSFMGGIHKVPQLKERVETMIEMVGLSKEAHKQIAALSKGYRQRVGIAQAMLHDPEALILDEPTSGLDPNQLVEIRELIRNIGRSKTVMLSTHIMQEVEAICNRIIVINQGKIVADKVSGDFGTEEHVILVEFNREIPADSLLVISGVLSAESVGTNSYALRISHESDPRGELFRFAVDQGVEVLSMHKKASSMEDIFKKLTKG